MIALVTGANGFIGRNLIAHLSVLKDTTVIPITRESSVDDLRDGLSKADTVYHLAGVNRPESDEEFETVNVGFTETICKILKELDCHPVVVLASSIQAENDTPYGVSKRRAEDVLKNSGLEVRILRLRNIFGKWCRPNYNSVVATFCYNLTHGLPITISDRSRILELEYIDDLVNELVHDADEIVEVISLGELADKLESFSENTLDIPDFSDPFTKKLYATYLSYAEPERLEQKLLERSDERGTLAEFVKSASFGQIFVSRTKPGKVRGNHYHHTKVEKFFVAEGIAAIRLRKIDDNKISSFTVTGNDFKVINIPPGYTHSIENVGNTDLVTIFWANEVFNVNSPDTIFSEVKQAPKISIVMTTFNRAMQLENTLESILRQGHKDLEIIVVDDGTDLETPVVCKKFPVKYTRLDRPQSGKYRNPAVPMNVGIRQAIGDIVILQNAECRHVDPDTISKLVNQVTTNNAVFARVTSLGQDGKPVAAYPIYCGKENPRPLFFCGAIKKSWFEKLRGFDEDYVSVCYEDDDFADRLKREGVSFVFTDIVVHHQFHPYLGHIDSTPSKLLYMKKSTDMAEGRIGTVRNVGRDWGVVGQVFSEVKKEIEIPQEIIKEARSSVEFFPVLQGKKYSKDGLTVDWWDLHKK